GAPGAADRVEGPSRERFQDRLIFERAGHELAGLLQRTRSEIGEREAAEGQCLADVHVIAAYLGQFERTAAEIARNAVGLVDAGDHAERGEPGLTLARQDFDRRAADLLGVADEVRAVLRLAYGRSRDHLHIADLDHVAERAKALQRAEGAGHS